MGALYARRLHSQVAKPSKFDGQEFSEGQVENALTACGISVHSRTPTDLLCYCPLHHNNNTPSFTISMLSGLWLCFNPACNKRGTLQSLLRRLGALSDDEVQLLLEQEEMPDIEPLELDDHTVMYPEDILSGHVLALPGSLGEQYLTDRGFPLELCQQYELGYDRVKDSITMGVRRYDGSLAGEVFRKRTRKEYKNSWGFVKTENLWNINQAKRKPEIVVCEGTLDSLACIRAGFNSVSFLGGAEAGVSEEQAKLLNVYFTKLYIFTDNDSAGKKFGMGLAESFAREVLFVPYGELEKTDPGGMTDEEIRGCIANSLTEFEVLVG